MSEYTQGICGDAAAILKDGQMMTIEEIVSQLSNLNRRVEELEMALQGFVDDSRGVYVRSGALVITTCESREIAIEALNSTKEAA